MSDRTAFIPEEFLSKPTDKWTLIPDGEKTVLSSQLVPLLNDICRRLNQIQIDIDRINERLDHVEVA